MAKEIYGSIPMRTWRWLGVNDAHLPENLAAETKERVIRVPEGGKERVVVVYREEQRASIRAEVADGAELELIRVQLLSEEKPHAGEVEIRVGKQGRVHYTAIEAGASASVTKLLVDLSGDGAIGDVAAIYFGDKKRSVDINYVIRQGGRSTEANMQVRGALAGGSEKIFRGTLDFLRGAKGSTGRENEEVVLLSPHVRNRSVPLMLSHEDDVDGHHAVSVGKMDQDKLFYLMSRGLDLSEAQRLVVEASFHPVIERIKDEALQEEIGKYVQERIAHGQGDT